MRCFSATARLLVLLTLAGFLTSCSRDPNVRKQKYLESGQRFYEKAKYREAAIEFANALDLDPKFAAAHYQLARTCMKLQRWDQAYQELAKTVDLEPDNWRARIDMTNLLIAGRQDKAAQEQIDTLLSSQPNNAEVHVAYSNLLALRENVSGAIDEMHKAIGLDPNRSESYINLASLLMKTKQIDEAEANFKKAVDLDPKSLSANMALASYYQARGRFADAEQQLQKAIAIEPRNPDPRSAMVRLYLAEGKNDQAEQFLRQTKSDLADDSSGYRMLGDYYLAIADLDRAVNEYASLYHDHPEDMVVKKNYIQLLILKNRFEDARKLNDEYLKLNSRDSEALLYRAEIEIGTGQLDEAVQGLQSLLQNEPENALAHYQLGVAFDHEGNLARAESEWRDAARLRPDLIDAQRALADAAVRKGDAQSMQDLEQLATQIISLQPSSPDGYAFRALSFMNRGKFTEAEADVRKAMEVAPQSTVGLIQMGNLQRAQHQYARAEAAYQQALDKDPNSPEALAGLLGAYIAENQVDKAVAAAQAQIAKQPSNSAFWNMLGTVLYQNKKDNAGAEAALRKSAELDRSNSDALLKLGQVQISSGSVDQALATYQQSMKSNPGDPASYILAGELYESKHDWEKARQMYQKALEIRPNDPLASNNLAYVVLQSGGNLDLALSLAQTARRGMPGSPNAADTLGWVFYLKGSYKPAIDLFQESLRLAARNQWPDNPNVHYHLGLAYQKDNQPALARQHLERVLKINPNYSEAAEVRKALAQLRS